MNASILVLNGPNLNMLGSREPGIYGNETLDAITKACQRKAEVLGLDVKFHQSNSEGELVTWIQKARSQYDAVVLNAGAYTHTSVAILDALLCSGLPVIEVHLSNIHRRDEFRHKSYVSKAAIGVIAGFGGYGYELALDAAKKALDAERSTS